MLRLSGQTQNHIVILTAVVLRPEKLRSGEQFSVKYAEMTNIIVRAQIIDRKIRLKMKRDHIVDAVSVKSCLIAVDVIRIFFADRFHIFIERRRMQYIVMVKKTDIFPACQRKAEIGIARNAAASFMPPVQNSAFRSDKLPQFRMRL